MAIVHFKRIPLLPTRFELDVWVSSDRDSIVKHAKERYGKSVELLHEELTSEMSCWIKDDEGVKRMLIFLKGFNPGIVAHEAIHTTWQLDKFVSFRYSYKHHEIQAYMVQYIVDEVLAMNKKK